MGVSSLGVRRVLSPWCAGMVALASGPHLNGDQFSGPTSYPRRLTCDPPQWSSLGTVHVASGIPVYVERPRLLVRRGEWTLLGDTIIAWAPPTPISANPPSHLFAGRLRGTLLEPWPVPPGYLQPAMSPRSPRSIHGQIDQAGRLVIVTATGDSGGYLQSLVGKTGRWSKAASSPTQPRISWDPINPAVLASEHATEVFLPVRSSDGTRSVRHFAVDSAGWHVRTTLPQVWAIYLRAIRLKDGTTILVFLSGDRQSPLPDRNSVFLSFLAPGSTTWSDPQVLSRSGAAGAEDPHLLQGSHGKVHLLWVAKSPAASATDTIRLLTSQDGGRNWTRQQAIAPGKAFRGLRASLAPDGRLHLLVTDGDGYPTYAAFSGTSWSRPQRLPAQSAIPAALNVIDSTRLGVFITVLDSLSVSGAVVPTTQLLVGLLRC